MLSIQIFKNRKTRSVFLFFSVVFLLASEQHFVVAAASYAPLGDHWTAAAAVHPSTPLQFLRQHILLENVTNANVVPSVEESSVVSARYVRDGNIKVPDALHETLNFDSSFHPESPDTQRPLPVKVSGIDDQADALQQQLRAQQLRDVSDADRGDWDWATEDEWAEGEGQGEKEKENQKEEEHHEENGNDDQEPVEGAGVVPQWQLQGSAAEDSSVATNVNTSGAGRRTSDRFVDPRSEHQWPQQQQQQQRNGQQFEQSNDDWLGLPSQQQQRQPLPPQQQLLPPNRNPYGRGGEDEFLNQGPITNGPTGMRGHMTAPLEAQLVVRLSANGAYPLGSLLGLHLWAHVRAPLEAYLGAHLGAPLANNLEYSLGAYLEGYLEVHVWGNLRDLGAPL
ncbi:uncharacterized protein EMH_0088810 [Eimeria mitis]|uniref:Uncharacterized protein n=1 Tax=Eimeria mitis TaxID=44415 RepID=U6KDA1_9EIME|nr:uncharacterized protein EMH_0088810 [Eimeria mitis]CDJ34232.1 hypothetical protein EMH_0088810 [Eimeria mitis]